MSIWNDIWELFFPRYCVVCSRRLLRGEAHLCLSCLNKMPRTGMHLQVDNAMEKNLWGKFALGKATAFMHYAKDNDVQKILYALKYYGDSNLGIFLGRLMATELQPSGFFQGIDCIIPVPLHERKKRKRGYNQSEMLASGLADVTGIPVFKHLIVRDQYTETQTRKGRFERWMNVQDVFSCPFPEELEGKHILLVDDVMTTGATLVSCADSLSGIPRLRISVLTLALAGGI